MSNKRITANATWIMVGRAFQLLLTFVSTMCVSRYLGPESYGRLTYVFSYIQLFLPLCTLGMNDIAVKELVDDREHNDTILGTIIGLRLLSSLLSMGLAILLVSLLNDGNPAYRMIAIAQSFALLFQSFDTIAYYYQSKLLSRTTGMVYMLAYTASSLFRFLGIFLNRPIGWFAFAMAFDYLMIALLFVMAYLRDDNVLHFSMDTARSLLVKSRYYIYAGLLVVAYGKVTDTLLLGKMVDDTSVGYYAAATTLCNAWPFILTAIIDASSPVIIATYEEDHRRFEQRLKLLYAVIFYIGIAAAVGITVLSEFVISILYGTDYLEASSAMKIYAWSTAFSYLGVARAIWMQCEKKISKEITISLFGALTNIILNFFLIARFRTVGAAIAAVLTQLLTNFLFLFAMKDTRENAKLIWEAILLKDIFSKEEDPDVQK